MKIATFTDTFYPEVTGITTCILSFSRELIKKGHEIIVLSPTYKNFKERKMRGMSVYRFFSFSLPSYPDVKIAIPNFIKMYNLIKKWNPDIIHIHTPGLMGYSGILLSKIFNIPLIGTFHTLVTEQLIYISPKKILKLDRLVNKLISKRNIKRTSQKNLSRFLEENLKKSTEKEEKGKKEAYTKRIIWKILSRIYNKCDKIIVPSKSIKKVLREHSIKKEIVVISNGVEIGMFKPKTKYGKSNLNLIHVGRISYEKNVDVIIKAVDIIRNVYPKVRFDIIGDGPALPNLKRLVIELSLSKNVRFLGKMDYKKLSSFYRKASIFLTASTMETQGLVILEAMACGLPVIGVDAFAIPDIVKNGFNGFLVKPGDIGGMASYIKLFIKNPKLIELLGKNALTSVKIHDLKKTSILLEKTYQKLIKNLDRVN